jgi:ribosome-associated heat shock protein Hsp15
MDKTRIDKWLWAVRIYKTRTLAATYCKKGNIKINGDKVKPSTFVSVGDNVQVSKDGFNLLFEVVKIIEKRVGFPIAQTCYENITSEEEMNKYNDWFVGKGRPEFREKGVGRPTKKDRRNLSEFKELYLFDDD